MDSEHKTLNEVLDSIKILPFKSEHYPLLIEMLESQNYPDIAQVTKKSLPRIGYIGILGTNHPVAAGFLRRVECDVMGQIDGLTSNAYFGGMIRHDAIVNIVNRLLDDAKYLNLQGVYAFTTSKDIILRAQTLDFKLIDQTIIIKSLV